MLSIRLVHLVRAAFAAAVLTALAACGGSDPQDLSFDLAVANGEAVGGQSTLQAKQGDTVTLNVTSDEDGEVHVHGYELLQDVVAGTPAAITFVANATGQFPIEFHPHGAADHADEGDAHEDGDNADIVLGVLQVQPR
jgi:hypothetical protein